jgi:glycine cleavage system H protein
MGYPSDLKYTKDHEWIRIAGDVAEIGITDYAQQQLGDVVYVELPEVGRQIAEGDSFGSIESVKAVSELFAPASGTVAEVNGALTDKPDAVNRDPYGDGWMIRITMADPKEVDGLMTAAQYRKYIEDEAN